MDYYKSGAAKQSNGDLDGAITDYSRAIELDPKGAIVYFNRGLAKKAKGDLEGAIADFNRTIELDPNNAKAYAHRGAAKQSKGDINGAIADYNRAIVAPAYNDRGNARKAKDDLDGAIADYSRAIELDPKNALACINRLLSRHRASPPDLSRHGAPWTPPNGIQYPRADQLFSMESPTGFRGRKTPSG